MYFCSGPPRTYALAAHGSTAPSTASDKPRVEDVALAVDPLQRVVARVTCDAISLWTCSARARRLHAQRLLVVVPRSGRFLTSARESLPPIDGVVDSGCDAIQQLWAVWVAGDRLAVVARGSQAVEFYAFDGLPASGAVVDAGFSDHDAGAAAAPPTAGRPSPAAPLSPRAGVRVHGRLVDEYALNQGDARRDREDVAWSMSGVAGGRDLFVGMESGLICVVRVAATAPLVERLWKIDVVAHLGPTSSSSFEGDDGDAQRLQPPQDKPSCYAVTSAAAASSSSDAQLVVVVVACFEGGKCFVLLVTPAAKTIEQLLSLVNTEREATTHHSTTATATTSSCGGRCTTAALDTSGTRLALGWSDGGASLFLLAVQRPTDKKTTTERPLRLKPLRELSMAPWGYTASDIGGVTTLAWTQDARALAVGYEQRGFAVFSTDGCRLMSSLPQHNHGERPMGDRGGDDDAHDDQRMPKEVCAYGALRLAWSIASTSLIVVARGQSFHVQEPPALDPSVAAEELLETPAAGSSLPPASVAASPAPPSSAPRAPTTLCVEDLYERVEVSLLKETDGLCLSLSGAPGRCGAWVRSFTRRRDGGVGPAELSQRITGGDLLVAINGEDDLIHWPFEQIIQTIKALPDHDNVTLVFLRLRWERVYALATRALASRAFLLEHRIEALLDDSEEELCIREYALRMQHQYGDCDLATRPPLLEFEKRAKFDGWEAIQGTPRDAACHKYIKLLLALFPTWDPLYVLQTLVDFAALARSDGPQQPDQDQDQCEDEEYLQLAQLRRLSSSTTTTTTATNGSHRLDGDAAAAVGGTMVRRRRRCSRVAFAEYDFARSVPLANRHSKLVLLEDASLRKLSSPALDDPCALVSAQSWSVPPAFDATCCPLRLVAVSASGQQIAVAGQRGFCVLNLATGKWRLFGNVHDEQDLRVHALLWVHEDVVLVGFSRVREQHRTLHVAAYPRDHLDEASILTALRFPNNDRHDAPPPVMVAMESDDDERNVFCLLQRELWCLGVACSGSLSKKTRDGDDAEPLTVSLTLARQVKLPWSVAVDASVAQLHDFAVIPRVLHVQNRSSSSSKHRTKSYGDDDDDDEEENDRGWFSSLVDLLAGGQVPDQYQPEEVLPRFALLNADGDVVVWDPETRSQRLLCSHVSAMTRVFVTHGACASWPTPCRLMLGLYGPPEGMKLWLPLLDGVYLQHTHAFEQDASRLESFLACHDPLRNKTYEIEFGTAPATAELYEHVVREYGIALEAFVAARVPSSKPPQKQQQEQKQHVARGRSTGCVTTLDDAASRDLMLRFDADVTLLGMQHAFGLLVGVSQDVYMPPVATAALPSPPCYDVLSRVQPFFHCVLCLLVRNDQLAWAAQVLRALRRNHFALSSPTQELFLHAMLEACFHGHMPLAKLQQAIQLLQPAVDAAAVASGGDMDEYCEIVAHVARKSEPSRLPLLFPAAGDPMELLAVCRQRGELRTAANFLLIVEECSSVASAGDPTVAIQTPTLAVRSACAAELVAQCIAQDEWALAKHVVRVAREWIDDHDHDHAAAGGGGGGGGGSYMDEQLAHFCWHELVSGRFERVVWCVEELQAELPPVHGLEGMGIAENETERIAQRIHDTFVGDGSDTNLRGLSVLMEAVTRAKYEPWMLLVQRVFVRATEPAETAT